jgi:hypothetical protein
VSRTQSRCPGPGPGVRDHRTARIGRLPRMAGCGMREMTVTAVTTVQTEIVAAVREKQLCGLKVAKRVLNAYTGRHWDAEMGMNNETRYRVRA